MGTVTDDMEHNTIWYICWMDRSNSATSCCNYHQVSWYMFQKQGWICMTWHALHTLSVCRVTWIFAHQREKRSRDGLSACPINIGPRWTRKSARSNRLVVTLLLYPLLLSILLPYGAGSCRSRRLRYRTAQLRQLNCVKHVVSDRARKKFHTTSPKYALPWSIVVF
jgi:hypothetical protein